MDEPIGPRAYHERTKHRLQGYARGPETVDWSAPPDPFRTFDGAPRVVLPLSAEGLTRPLRALDGGVAPCREPSLESVGALFELTFAISAWKRQGPDLWAVRCHPSSGNLHPTEAYLIAHGFASLADGLYHYDPREHALEWRREGVTASPRDARLYLGLSSIHWREAWKYGERAFRYCQLDLGHALAGLHYAAALLGWQVRVLSSLSTACVGTALGLHRSADFEGAEPEEPALIAAIALGQEPLDGAQVLGDLGAHGAWHGRANRLDKHPMYSWPVLDAVARATERSASTMPQTIAAPAEDRPPGSRIHAAAANLGPLGDQDAVQVIRQRRSAQRFDARFTLSGAQAAHLFEALLPRSHGPSRGVFSEPGVHGVAFVHRVDGLEPGVYALPRSCAGERWMRAALDTRFLWEEVRWGHGSSPLRLARGPMASVVRRLCCGQAIAADAAVVFAFLASLDASIDGNPHRYRELHWEAGVLGHILYIEAQAMGLSGTGIGCFFDDELHRSLGISDTRLQTLYCFSVGLPLHDARIQTMPAYARPNHDAQETTP